MTSLNLAVALASLAFLSSCGSQADEGATDGTSSKGTVVKPYDVVPLSPDHGPGSAIAVTAARITSEGGLQVLVDGFSCGVPTAMQVEEKEKSVTVGVDATRVSDDPCPADVVPWYIAVDLNTPLNGRTVIAADSGQSVRVVDCARQPDADNC
jgi:hypothetical protein